MILSNLLCSNVKKRRIEMIILYLKIVKKNNNEAGAFEYCRK